MDTNPDTSPTPDEDSTPATNDANNSDAVEQTPDPAASDNQSTDDSPAVDVPQEDTAQATDAQAGDSQVDDSQADDSQADSASSGDAPERAPAPDADATPAEDTPAEDTTADAQSAGADTGKGEGAEAVAAVGGAALAGAAAETAQVEGEATSADGGDAEATKPKPKGKGKGRERRPPQRRRPAIKAPELPKLDGETQAEAKERARARTLKGAKHPKGVTAALDAILAGVSIPFLARFRRAMTEGGDEYRLRMLRSAYEQNLHREQRRLGVRALLKKRGGLTEEIEKELEELDSIPAMEDLAAPFLPVVASRATVARGQGLQALADAIRSASEVTPLSELAAPHVPEGSEPSANDICLGGARDIVAEELSLSPVMRARLRALFQEKGLFTVSLRSERKGDAGRFGSLVGLSQLHTKVPAMKVLMARRGEKERVLVSHVEPPEEEALAIVHAEAAAEGHPHAGFLRAAAEDGYRRILKPLLQHELRAAVKARADREALDVYERNLRNLLLGPVGGPVATLGVRPDVTGGHRWCAIDAAGQPVGSGQLPHEPTAGRDPVLAELEQVLRTYECHAIAIGTSGGRAEALSLANAVAAAREDGPLTIATIVDGGTRALESLGPLEFDDRPTVAAEQRGALSLARRFQDPLRELVQIDPKAMGLGPHVPDVNGRYVRQMVEDVFASCIAHVGPDVNRAPAHLLAHAPGLNARAAKSIVAHRETHGPFAAKGSIAAVEHVGPEVAEQAVGFLRVSGAVDPRDTTQLHPEQFGLIDKLAESAGVDVPTLFTEPRVRAGLRLESLVGDDADIHALRYALFQATAGNVDPRPLRQELDPLPPHVRFDTLEPGQLIKGRVLRAAPFGVFVDVGFKSDALLPTPHIGERPGLEQAVVAPVGAVIVAAVLDVDPRKKKLTLTMRRDAGPARGGPRHGGPRGARRGAQGGPPRGGPRGAGRGRGDRQPVGAGARGTGGTGQGRGQGGRPSGGQGGRPSGGPGGRGKGKGAGRKSGRFESKGFDLFSKGGRGRGRGRDSGGGGPRNIRLKPDEPELPPEAEITDESKLTPEEVMKRKLEALKRKFERGREGDGGR